MTEPSELRGRKVWIIRVTDNGEGLSVGFMTGLSDFLRGEGFDDASISNELPSVPEPPNDAELEKAFDLIATTRAYKSSLLARLAVSEARYELGEEALDSGEFVLVEDVKRILNDEWHKSVTFDVRMAIESAKRAFNILVASSDPKQEPEN
jgi:hypothetical protein